MGGLLAGRIAVPGARCCETGASFAMVLVAGVVTDLGVSVHTALYIAVGFIWLTWMECGGHRATVRESQQRYRYQFGSMVCSLIFMDNVMRKMGASGESSWFWLASGKTNVIFLSGILIVVCQFQFWSTVVWRKRPRFRKL